MKIKIWKNGALYGHMTHDSEYNLDWQHNDYWSCGEPLNHEHVTQLENGEYVHIHCNNTQGHKTYADVISSKQAKTLLQEAESRKK